MKYKKGCINVGVANLYYEPAHESEVITQGLLGETVDMLEYGTEFTRIRQTDAYESWISNHQISEPPSAEGKSIVAREHFIRIYQDKNMSLPLKDAGIGCRLLAVDEDDTFYRIFLPSGELGWVQKKQFNAFPDFSPEAVIRLAREFMGYPYFWGGKTPRGFDCSGFVQFVFSLLGKQINRDAWMQAKEGEATSKTYQDARISDLVFFGDKKDKITHVGISLGNNKFIHALGWVRINSLNPEASDFSQKHANTFIQTSQYME